MAEAGTAPIDKGRQRRYDGHIEWRTYTPDGRVLTVRHSGSTWAAVCGDGGEYRSADLEEAIRDAVGHERGESLTLQLSAYDAVKVWVAEAASRIEAEYERGD